jgi:hypothetical protein
MASYAESTVNWHSSWKSDLYRLTSNIEHTFLETKFYILHWEVLYINFKQLTCLSWDKVLYINFKHLTPLSWNKV